MNALIHMQRLNKGGCTFLHLVPANYVTVMRVAKYTDVKNKIWQFYRQDSINIQYTVLPIELP